jgi:3-deoxy-D-manno-octulosonic-acid transferase
MWLYSMGLCVALVAGLPFWLLRMATRGKYRAGLPERFGRVPARLVCGARQSIWIHAVSVGEVIAVLPLAAQLAEEHPEFCVLLSTTTQAGQQVARQRWGAERVFYFPLDFRWIVRRYLRVLKPALIVLAETELWPNFIVEADHARVPIAVVNARISDRSYPRYRRLRRFWRPQLQRIALYCAQSDEDARRLREIGARTDRVRVAGNLKFDVSAARSTALVDRLRSEVSSARVLVAGSTLDGEEKLLLEMWPELTRSVPGLLMILAPRHPERFAAVAAMLAARGIAYTRRSKWDGEPLLHESGSVFLLDSIGELASVYSLATVAFLGGSALRGGGHNPLEPAQWGVPVVMGESYENFRGIVDALRAADAIRIAPREKLLNQLQALLGDEEGARAMGERARALAQNQAGALQRSVDSLNVLLAERAR